MIIKTSLGEYKIGGIYKHYKGNYYQIDNVAFLHDSQNIYLVIYHQCDENGVFISIRDEKDTSKIKIFQPFCTHENRWNDELTIKNEKIKRFTLIK